MSVEMNGSMNAGMSGSMNAGISRNMSAEIGRGMDAGVSKSMDARISGNMNAGVTRNMNAGISRNMSAEIGRGIDAGVSRSMDARISGNIYTGMSRRMNAGTSTEVNAIEIRNLNKSFGSKQAVRGLNMTVPVGSIYGFIGENGSGKSTTEKLICGLLIPDGGSIKLYGKDYTDPDVRSGIGVLIEAPGCYPNYSVWNNLMLQATNLDIQNPKEEIAKVLKTVRMEGAASNKFRNCSLGMKQRIGIAMALLGHPSLLVLDEPINGLDADGMRIMREVLVDITRNWNCTVLISSHILGELEKIATHYGIIRRGQMIKEMTAKELDADCRTYTALRAADMSRTKTLLGSRYSRVEADESGYLRVYDSGEPEEIVSYLYENGILVSEIRTDKIGLEEYYIDLMNEKGGR